MGDCRKAGQEDGALVYVSNKADPRVQPLPRNRLHAIGNRLLDTPWAKLVRGKRIFQSCLAAAAMLPSDEAVARLFLENLLNDGVACDPATDTGYPVDFESHLASICIKGVALRPEAPLFGTVTQCVMLVTRDDRVFVLERSLVPGPTEDERRRSLNADHQWSEVQTFEVELE